LRFRLLFGAIFLQITEKRTMSLIISSIAKAGRTALAKSTRAKSKILTEKNNVN
jgi:hypothetical protein